MTRDPSLTNPNPVVVTKEITRTSSDQIADYFLCAECEDAFNKHGERYAMSQVHNGKSFPLPEGLAACTPSYIIPSTASTPEFKVYFATNSAHIDREKLAYFCLSIFWRASAHTWKGVTSLDLGPYQETIRRYLLGIDKFPKHLVIQFFVANDALTQQTTFPPGALRRMGPFRSYGFTSRGFVWWLHVGKGIAQRFYSLCLVNSPIEPVVICDCEPKTLDAFVKLSATSRVACALRQRTT
jgi:hypothetical protein